MVRQHREAPGAPPGTLRAPAGAIMPKGMHVIHYTASALEEVDAPSVAAVAPYREREGVTWVNVDGLGDVDIIRDLGALFGLHPLALEDVLSLRQRPKVDNYENHLYIVSRMLHLEETLKIEQVSTFLGENFLVTFQEYPGDCLEPIRDRLRKGVGQLRQQGADYLAYAVVDALTDHYFPVLERLGELVEQLEDEVVEKPTRRTLGRVHEVKRGLLHIRQCIWPLREAINTLIRDESPLIGRTTRVYLRDCYDHALRVLDVVETYRELVAGLVDVYVSSVSNKLNEVMKVLTVISTIFIPLTFIVGVYGMNFQHMPEIPWKWGYLVVWGVMLLLAGMMLLLFRRKGWLGSRRET